MNLTTLRAALAASRVALRFGDHTVIEAHKDGLTTEDLEDAVAVGEIIEDYGRRVLLLSFTREDRLPCHAVLEYVSGRREATVVTAYVPDAKEWRRDWKTGCAQRQCEGSAPRWVASGGCG